MVDDAYDLNPVDSKHNTKGLKTPLTYSKYALYFRILISSHSKVQQCKWRNTAQLNIAYIALVSSFGYRAKD